MWHLVLWWIGTDIQTNMLLSLAGFSETLLYNNQTTRCETSYGSFLDSHCRESSRSKNILEYPINRIWTSVWNVEE